MSRNTKTKTTLFLLLVLLPLVAYLNVFQGDFTVLDDTKYILENEHVMSGLSAESIAWSFSAFYGSNWHPLTWISHMLDVQLFGASAFGPHFTNLLLHILNTELLFALLLCLKLSARRSFLVAALFALHPLHVESVAWISERKDLLCGMFWLMGLITYAQYTRSAKKMRYYLATHVCLVCSLMAKQMSVTFPLVVVLLDMWPLRRMVRLSDAWKLIVEKIPMVAIVLAAAAYAYSAQRHGGAVVASEVFGLWDRAFVSVYGYTQYLLKMIVPVGLGPVYVLNEGDVSILYFAIGSAVLLFLTWGCLRARISRPYLLFGWLWYLGTLVPVIGIVKLGLQSMADRYTYIPLIGPFIALVWLVAEVFEERGVGQRVRAYVYVSVLCLCLALTMKQTTYWVNSVTLFGRALDINPVNYTAHFGLGAYYHYTGDLSNAALHYEKGLSIRSNIPRIQAYLAYVYSELGNHEASIATYMTLLGMTAPGSHNGAYYYHIGRSYEALGRRDAAAESYRIALDLDPDISQAADRLSVLELQK